MLVKNTNDEIAGVLNKKLKSFLKTFERLSKSPKEVKILVKNINGSILGKTLSAHAEIPSNVTFIYSDGNKIIFKMM
jgi:hypothetical protein